MGGIVKLRGGNGIPTSKSILKLIIGKLGRLGIGNEMGGIVKFKLGNPGIPKSETSIPKFIIGKEGIPGIGNGIGGILNVGKSHGPGINHFAAKTEVEGTKGIVAVSAVIAPQAAKIAGCSAAKLTITAGVAKPTAKAAANAL